MEKAKALNLKTMKEALINYSSDSRDLEKIWDGFHMMYLIGFISSDTWTKFFDQCKGWYITSDLKEVRDSENDDKLVWSFSKGPFKA